MKKIVYVLVSFLTISTLILLNGCGGGDPLSEDQYQYAGKWQTEDGSWIEITKEGGGNCKVGSTSVTGGSTKIEGNTLTIGLMGIGPSFNIDNPPAEVDGNWVMTLDGKDYTKIE